MSFFFDLAIVMSAEAKAVPKLAGFLEIIFDIP